MSAYKNSHSDTATATATFKSLNPLHLHALPPYSSLLFDHHTLEPTSAATTTTAVTTTNHRTQIAKEEAKIEQAIIKTITSGDIKTLNANSGQAVHIGGEHYVCVSYNEEAESDYRVWEWHGHVVLCDGENGYSQEYVYGNYFERLMRTAYVEESYDDGEERERERRERGFGLVELIGGLNLSSGRIISRHINDRLNRF